MKMKEKANLLKMDLAALFLACKKKETPLIAKVVTGIVVAYALSPIDLIPDFIPVLGYLDDLILLPLGISLALKLIPPRIMEECRIEAIGIFDKEKPKNLIAAMMIILFWILIISWIVMKVMF